jgi:hypothetical protein
MVVMWTDSINAAIWARCGSISGQVLWRELESLSSGNQPSTRAVHSTVVMGGPPGTIPAAMAEAVYADGLRVDAERRAQLADAPPRVPVHEDFLNFDHLDRSPCQSASPYATGELERTAGQNGGYPSTRELPDGGSGNTVTEGQGIP